ACADVAAEGLSHAMARPAPESAVRLAEQVQGLIECDFLAVDAYPNLRAQLLEQPHPRRVADRAEVGQDSFFGLRQLMRPEESLVLHEMPVSGRVGVFVQPGCVVVRDLRQLQWKEHEVRASLGARLSHPAEKAARGVVLRV